MIYKTTKWLLIFLLSVTSLYSQLIYAADFTLNVPINLKNIDSRASYIFVRCLISKTKYRGDSPAATRNVIGRARVKVSIPYSGNINRVIPVRINADSNRIREEAKTYLCSLGASGSGFDMQAVSKPNSSYFREEYRLKPGAPFVWRVEGRLK